MTLSLNRAEILRPQALAAIDRAFAPKINALLGPLATLHTMKRQQALAGKGALVEEDEAEAVLARAAEQDEALAELDRRRLDLKARVRAAATAAEITAILSEVGP